MQMEKRTNRIDKYAAAMLESIGDGVISTDLEGRIDFFNHAAEEIIGCKADEALGKDFDSVFATFNAIRNERLEAPIKDVIKNNTTRDLVKDTIIITRDNTRKYISAACSPIREGELIIGVIIVFRDITRLRISEIEHQKEKDCTVHLLNQLPAIIWRTDEALNCSYVNSNWMEFTGMSLEKTLEYGWKEVLHPEDQGRWENINKKAFFNKEPFELHMRVRRSDGEYRWCVNTGRPQYDLNGKFDGYVGIVQDVTDKKTAVEKTIENQGKYRSLFMNMHSGYIYFKAVYDDRRKIKDLLFVEANETALKMLGVKDKKVIGECYTELFPMYTAIFRKMIKGYAGILSQEMKAKEAEVVQSKSGKWFNISAYSPEKDHLVAIITDVTHIKEYEIELEKAKEAAEAANRSKSEFLANMSHEIRTPINGMVGMVDLTLLSNLNEDQKENLITAKACANSLLNIINDVLDFSKMEAGKMKIVNENFDIRKLIEETVKIHSSRATEKGLELNYSFSSTIPQYFFGDPNRLRQVLNNLVGNAVKFTEYGTITVSVSKTSEKGSETEIKFAVSDTGIGIGPEDIGRLFKSFSQVDSSFTKKVGGTGLGLIISKKLVEMMGGTIWVESEKGKGSNFFVLLKFKAGRKEAEKEVTAPQLDKAVKTLNILLAEDDAINCKVISAMLREKGYIVDAVSNGMDAVVLFSLKKYDAVLMDIQMPEMNGIEAARKIRKMEEPGYHTPIIAITAYALQGDREKFLSLGMDSYIPKPIQMEELFNTLDCITSAGPGNKDFMPDRVEIGENGEIKFTGKKQNRMDGLAAKSLLQIERLIEKLEEYIKIDDLGRVERTAHQIKMIANEIEADEIKNSAFKIELAARRGNPYEAIKCLGMIRSEFEVYNAYSKSQGEERK